MLKEIDAENRYRIYRIYAESRQNLRRARTRTNRFFSLRTPKNRQRIGKFRRNQKTAVETFAEHSIYFHPGTKNLPLVVIAIFRKGEKMILDKIIEILIHKKT